MSYEFTETENQDIIELSESLKAFTVPLLLLALLELALVAVVYFLYKPQSATLLYLLTIPLGVVGFYFASLSGKIRKDFHLIVDTEGSDLGHLMDALEKLKTSLKMGAGMACLLAVLLLVALSNALPSVIG